MSRQYKLRPKEERGEPYSYERSVVGTVFTKKMLGGIAKITITKIGNGRVEYIVQGVKVVNPSTPRQDSLSKFKRFINSFADATKSQRWAAGL